MLRAIVASYVGDAAPVGSRSISHVLPLALSAASIRNTMAELTELGLIEKPHASAGRVPTARGLRRFVDHLVPRALDEFERRDLAGSVSAQAPDALIENASKLLSQRTRQLGFVMTPRRNGSGAAPRRAGAALGVARARGVGVADGVGDCGACWKTRRAATRRSWTGSPSR